MKSPKFLFAFLAAIGFALTLYVFGIEPRLLVVREYNIATRHWGGEPLRIAMISDTHVGGPHVNAERMARVVARINGLEPDLIVLLGDYEHGHLSFDESDPAFRDEVEAGLVAFGGLEAPCGMVSILGNHDWWYDGHFVRDTLEAEGLIVLENEAVRAPCGGRDFWIAGLADRITRYPDHEAAMGEIPTGENILLLSHNPDEFADLDRDISLMMAGHSHGGQVVLPLLGRPIVPSDYGQRFAYGHIEEGGRSLVVTSGIGESKLPLRFGVPPEIAVVILSGAGD